MYFPNSNISLKCSKATTKINLKMGKNKKGFNWKARQQNERAIDDTHTRVLNAKVNILEKSQEKGYDD